MQIISGDPAGLVVLAPRVFEDARGDFFESYNEAQFSGLLGRPVHFVQDNHSRSQKNVLRGLHYQLGQPQGKLVRVVSGSIFDVAVDLRRSTPTFGRWDSVELSAENRLQHWIPVGFAHGFLALSDNVEVLYKTTDFWSPQHERCIRWNDPQFAIDWPLEGEPIVSDKDAAGALFKEAEHFG